MNAPAKTSGRTKLQIVIAVEDQFREYFVETETYICPTESGYIKVGQLIEEGDHENTNDDHAAEQPGAVDWLRRQKRSVTL